MKDFDKAVAFYQRVLGFQAYLDHRDVSDSSTEHVLGLSKKAMKSVIRKVRIVDPSGKANDGSIEIL